MARKPRPRAMYAAGMQIARLGPSGNPYPLHIIGAATLTLREARRLRAWLDRAIAWMEERERRESGEGGG